MAVSIPPSSFSASIFPTDSSQTSIFPDDSISIGLYTTFGEDDSNTTSFGSWADPPYSCSELEVSSFPSGSADTTFTSLLNSPVLPCEDDLNLAPEFLEPFDGCHYPSTPMLVHSEFVDTPKDMMEEELYVAEENQFAPGEFEAFMGGSNSLFSDNDDQFNQGRLEKTLRRGDCVPASNDENSVEEEEEPSDRVHIPPPLNMKRIEMYDDAYYESIEAAEVPLDVIENKRPFHCGLAGCDKTFKNPQTMKMHHKTHFSDGSALHVEDHLPTFPPPGIGNSNPNGNSSWMTGRSKKIPSRCPKCRKTFVGLYELRRHYGRKHSEGERPFQCRKCDKRFYIEVDVRDHEKLCGEQLECKCGLKFAFKCNMVAHQKAHPACQDAPPTPTPTPTATSATLPNATSAHSTSTLPTSVNIIRTDPSRALVTRDPHTTPALPTMSSAADGDSSRSRWIRPEAAPPPRAPGSKRCLELVEETRPYVMAKLTKVYSRRTLPAQNVAGLGLPGGAACDGQQFGGGALWGSPCPNMPWAVQAPGGASAGGFGSLDPPFPRVAWGPTKLGALDLLHLAGVTPGL